MKNKTDIAIFQGRFQGFNIGHQNAIKELQKKFEKVIVFIVEGKKSNKDENPFPSAIREEMLKISCKGIKIFVVPNGFIPGSIKFLKLHTDNEKVFIATGEDREESYKKFKTDYEIEFIQTKRPLGVSGTLVRKSLLENDFVTFRKIAAKGINNKKWFDKLRKIMIE